MNQITVVTVSIPERTLLLREAGESLQLQTYGPVPWLVRVEEPDHFGPEHVARQRNTLLKAVETPWMAVLDDDDTFDPNYLEVMSQNLEGADVVYSWCRAPHLQSEFDPELLRRENYIDGECLIRTEALREIGGYPVGPRAEDYALWIRMLEAGMRFRCVPQALRDHRKVSPRHVIWWA